MKPILKNYLPQSETTHGMAMKKKSTQQDFILNDVVHCACCGTSMVVEQTNYVCPNAGQGPDFCPTMRVDAQDLAHQLMATLVNRVVTPSALPDLVERIRRDVADQLSLQQDNLDQTEAAIERLNSRRRKILSEVEYGEVSYAEVAAQLDTIEASHAGFVYESDILRKEIDKLGFVGNEEAIRSVAQDIATYTELADPELAKELVNTFIDDIRVGSASFEVAYTHPIPGERGKVLVASETFPLP